MSESVQTEADSWGSLGKQYVADSGTLSELKLTIIKQKSGLDSVKMNLLGGYDLQSAASHDWRITALSPESL